jgi:hypothetical protein
MQMRHALKTEGDGLKVIITESQETQNQSDPLSLLSLFFLQGTPDGFGHFPNGNCKKHGRELSPPPDGT